MQSRGGARVSVEVGVRHPGAQPREPRGLLSCICTCVVRFSVAPTVLLSSATPGGGMSPGVTGGIRGY